MLSPFSYTVSARSTIQPPILNVDGCHCVASSPVLVTSGLEGEVSDDLLDELLAGARTEEEITGLGGLLSQLTKRLLERAMEVELTVHLG